MIGLAKMMVVAGTPAGADLPVGTIAMWYGLLANIPAGWALCDGIAASPDLRGKFLKGAAAAADPGATGGAATHVHDNHAAQTHAGAAVSDHPALVHSGFAFANHAVVTTIGYYNVNQYCLENPAHTMTQESDHAARTHTMSAQENQHDAESHAAASNEPAFYTIAYIRKT